MIQNEINTSATIAIALLNEKAVTNKLPKKFQERVNKAETLGMGKKWLRIFIPLIVILAIAAGIFFLLEQFAIIPKELSEILGSIMLFLFAIFSLVEYTIRKRRASQSMTKKIDSEEALENELKRLAQDYPELYHKITLAYEFASERKRNKFFLEYFLVELFFTSNEINEDILTIDEARRMMISVSSGKQFIEAVAIRDAQPSSKYLEELKTNFNNFESLLAIFEKATTLPQLIVEESTKISKACQEFLKEILAEEALVK